MQEPKRQETISSLAKEDIAHIEKQLKASNRWVILSLFLLLTLGGVLTIWETIRINLPGGYMYFVGVGVSIVGVFLRFFGTTKFGRFILWWFALIYLLFFSFMLFDNAFNGVYNPSTGQLIKPNLFWAAGTIFSLSTLLYILEPLFAHKRKKIIQRVKNSSAQKKMQPADNQNISDTKTPEDNKNSNIESQDNQKVDTQ